MDWFKVKSIEELRALGKMNVVKKSIVKSLGSDIKVTSRSWNELYDTIKSLQNLFHSKFSEELQTSNHYSHIKSYFNSEEDELIFYLLELNGEIQLEKLKITKFHYSNNEYAKVWRNKLVHKLHPDVCKHPKAVEATAAVNKLYERMTASNGHRR